MYSSTICFIDRVGWDGIVIVLVLLLCCCYYCCFKFPNQFRKTMPSNELAIKFLEKFHRGLYIICTNM